LDIKLKNNSRLAGRILFFLIIAILTSVAVASYPEILKKAEVLEQKQANPDSGTIDNQKDLFLKKLFQANYSLSWDIERQNGKSGLAPSDIYLPRSLVSGEDRSEYAQEFVSRFNHVIEDWQRDFFLNSFKSYNLEYLAIDNKTKKKSTNSLQQPLIELADHPRESPQLNDIYSFYTVINYQPDGTMDIPVWHGMDDSKKNALILAELNNTIFGEEKEARREYIAQIAPPQDLTIIYAAKSGQFYMDQSGAASIQDDNFNEAGFLAVYWLSIGCVILLALLLFRISWYSSGSMATRIPVELWIIGMMGTVVFYDTFLQWSNENARGNFFKDGGGISTVLIWFKEISGDLMPLSERTLSQFFIIVVWLLILSVWHIGVLSALQVFHLGVKRYSRERMLLGKWSRWIRHVVRNNIVSVKKLNLSDPHTKLLAKILAVHFAIIALISCTWFFGIVLLIPYSLVVFFALRKYLNKIRSNYSILFSATRQMAEKNLEISIDEDLGLFNPLKEQLQKIMDGFKRAVDEETKSQKTKSELITNVSHDLKTPVTAIITYVSLLQNDQLSNEEKRAYIEILNNKSQRLKRLIDDLFEFTGTSSGNVSLNLVDVDLVELIKQVQVELSDQIADSRVQFRLQQPEGKVILALDSEKTFRIFENLYTNVIKYSPPDSRAYVEVQNKDGRVTVIFKNVSSFELDFTPDEIMERFVRGDKSRHTEGSGLGLAIVKNLVELQGGSFRIELDGDLFKAIMEWASQPA
jgi:signal transduction histidine kinase